MITTVIIRKRTNVDPVDMCEWEVLAFSPRRNYRVACTSRAAALEYAKGYLAA